MSESLRLGVFSLDVPVGEGAAGVVWRGSHPASGEAVAVKVISAEGSDPRRAELLRAEVRSVAALDHPGIVLVLDHGSVTDDEAAASDGRLVQGTPWLAMELADRGTLESVTMPLAWPALKRALRSILGALAFAHAHGVIHRDLKPANILRFSAGRGRPARLKLADFGLAHALAERKEGAYEAPAGTPLYMAPEQIEGSWRDYGPWTDLYALGCTAWQLATGYAPFRGDLRAVVFAHLEKSLPSFSTPHPLPDGFVGWLHRLLEKSPGRRFRSAADALWKLDHFDEPDRPAPFPASWRVRSSAPVRPRLVGAGLGLHGLRPVRLAGRVAERELIWEALREATMTRRPRAVVLSGAAGTGKSRLATWTARRANELGAAEVLWAGHGPVPSEEDGLAGLVRRRLRVQGLGREAVFERVRQYFDASATEDTWSADALTALVVSGDPQQGRHLVTRPEERFEVVRSLLADSTADRAAVVVMDDVHWGAESVRFASWLLAPLEDRQLPVLLLLTVRDETLAERPVEASLLRELKGHPACAALPIEPLEPEDRDELIGGMLGLSGDVAGALAHRSGGNPLFAVQLVTSWVEAGLLVPRLGGFAPGGALAAQLPDDLHAVWSGRLERLVQEHAAVSVEGPEEALRALELAAALGLDVEDVEWASVCEEAELPDPAALMERLLGSRLAVRRVGGWRFVHGMLREALERGAREAGRWRSHQHTCITVLDLLHPKSGSRLDERRARHLCAAGRWEEALAPLLQASSTLRRRATPATRCPCSCSARRRSGRWASPRPIAGGRRTTPRRPSH